ncbi:hypothetical protein K438DRAFT_2008865 [Mycena galopus ATCC 62051]|nr:hypothetical protein K438DRAFT_2008865 [Mycena galopus ATCC 62051]
MPESLSFVEVQRLLAGFYGDLDPAGIPTVEEVEKACAHTGRAQLKAHRGLGALLHLSDAHAEILAPKTYPAFWPRVWAWFQFIDTYADCLPGPVLGVEFRYIPLFIIVSAMLHDATTASIIESTPGVRYVLARGWARILERPGAFLEVRPQIFHIIEIHFKVHDPQNLAEIFDGVGGSISDVAAVLTKYIDHCYVSSVAPLAAMDAETKIGTLQALQLMNDLAHVTPGLDEALIYHGIVKSLVWIIRTVDFKTATETEVAICPGALMRFLTNYPDVRLVVTALAAGFLSCISHSLSRNFKVMRDILTNFLPAYIVYHSVLTHIEGHNSKLHSFIHVDDPDVVRSPLLAAWRAFADLVTERLQTKKTFDLIHPPSAFRCQNTQCGKAYQKRDFKICSACLSRTYCSPECQKHDWMVGGHSTDCSEEQGTRLDDLRTKDRLFLRFLIRADYDTRLKEIRRKQVEFSLTSPACLSHVGDSWDKGIWIPYASGFAPSVYTSFNYLVGRPTITVLPARELEDVWVDDVKRMRGVQGKIEVHEVVFLRGDEARSVVLPLRISSGRA